jgi:hypothetical protein
MFSGRRWAGRLLAFSLGCCLAPASIGPSVAIACEGGGEEVGRVLIAPASLSFRNVRGEEGEITVTNNEPREEVDVVDKLLEGREPEGWENETACISEPIAANGGVCRFRIKLKRENVREAIDKITIEFLDLRRTNFVDIRLTNR